MKKLQPVIGGLVVLVIILLVYFYFNGREKSYSWYESYQVDSDQPYGTMFMRKLMEGYRPDGKFIFNDKNPIQKILPAYKQDTTASYVYIGQAFYPDNNDIKELLDFVAAGNDALIATSDIPDTIAYRLHMDDCVAGIPFVSEYTDSVSLNFYHPNLHTAKGYNYNYRVGAHHIPYTWKSFNDTIFCTSSEFIVPLGYQHPGHTNFIKMGYGKGFIYFHSNPLVFTNYFLIHPDKMSYAAGVFSHLNGKNIIWDEYSKLPWMGNVSNPEGPLYYILQQPSLKYAWWMMLLAVLLYVLFAAKRIQRVIPVLEAKTNTSLEFIYLIAALHLQNGNPLDMARKKMKYFLYFVRSRYGIQAQPFKEEHMMRLAEKSKVNLPEIKTIFDQYNSIEHNAYYNTQNDKLVSLFDAIENFNQKCK